MIFDIFVMLFRFSLLYLILSLALVAVPLALMAWHTPRYREDDARQGDME
jgi:hypothetical protein